MEFISFILSFFSVMDLTLDCWVEKIEKNWIRYI